MVVLTGAGDKAFVAGADIKEMVHMGVLESHAWGSLGHECGRLLESMPKPTIAAVNGFAVGGGCELALACDIRYASENAKFGQPEISLGKKLFDEMDAAPPVHPHEQLLERSLETASALAKKSPVALSAAKDAANRALQGDLGAGLSYEAILFSALFATEDQKEGMMAFSEKREARFRGR